MKILANISEPFVKLDNKYVSKYTAVNFLKRFSSIKYSVPICNHLDDDQAINTILKSNDVFELPEFHSALDFIKKFLLNRSFRTKFLSIKEELKKHEKIWVRAPSIDSIFIAFIALKQKKPVIMHIAGDLNGVWNNEKYSFLQKIIAFGFAKILLFLIELLINNKNVYILCTGESLTKRYSKAKNGSVQFFDTNLESDDTTRVRHDKVFNLLYVGRLEKDKGIENLLLSFKKINDFEKYKKIKLSIIGFGSSSDKIKRFINENNLKININYIGFVSNDKLSGFYKSHDALIFPSMAPEGFPRVIQEAWLYDLPVITSDTGGISGVAIDNKNALVFNSGDFNQMEDKIIELYDNEVLYQNLIKEIRIRKKIFCAKEQEIIARDRIEEASYEKI